MHEMTRAGSQQCSGQASGWVGSAVEWVWVDETRSVVVEEAQQSELAREGTGFGAWSRATLVIGDAIAMYWMAAEGPPEVRYNPGKCQQCGAGLVRERRGWEHGRKRRGKAPGLPGNGECFVYLAPRLRVPISCRCTPLCPIWLPCSRTSAALSPTRRVASITSSYLLQLYLGHYRACPAVPQSGPTRIALRARPIAIIPVVTCSCRPSGSRTNSELRRGTHTGSLPLT